MEKIYIAEQHGYLQMLHYVEGHFQHYPINWENVSKTLSLFAQK